MLFHGCRFTERFFPRGQPPPNSHIHLEAPRYDRISVLLAAEPPHWGSLEISALPFAPRCVQKRSPLFRGDSVLPEEAPIRPSCLVLRSLRGVNESLWREGAVALLRTLSGAPHLVMVGKMSTGDCLNLNI